MTVEEHASQLKNQVKEPSKKTVIADDKKKVYFFKKISIKVILPLKNVLYSIKNFCLMLFYYRILMIQNANLNIVVFLCLKNYQ